MLSNRVGWVAARMATISGPVEDQCDLGCNRKGLKSILGNAEEQDELGCSKNGNYIRSAVEQGGLGCNMKAINPGSC